MEFSVTLEGRNTRGNAPQRFLSSSEIAAFHERGIVFGADGGCLTGPVVYALASGSLVGVDKFLSYTWWDNPPSPPRHYFQPVVQTFALPGPDGRILAPDLDHFFAYEIISDSGLTVSRIVRFQRRFRARCNAVRRSRVRAVAIADGASLGTSSYACIVQCEPVLAMLDFACGCHHLVGRSHLRRIVIPLR